ncbi:hypothetical protein Hanom_Chr07g00618731 [Helianthus anomalus]
MVSRWLMRKMRLSLPVHGTKAEVQAATSANFCQCGNFVNQRQGPSYKDFNRGQQAVYDNVSAGIGEGREYEVRRKAWEEIHGT